MLTNPQNCSLVSDQDQHPIPSPSFKYLVQNGVLDKGFTSKSITMNNVIIAFDGTQFSAVFKAGSKMALPLF
jgi:hypothetical protein